MFYCWKQTGVKHGCHTFPVPQPPIQEWLGGSSFQKCLWTSQGPWRMWFMNHIKRLAQSLVKSEHSTNVNYFSRFHVQLELRITEMENWTWSSGVGGLAGMVEMLRKERDVSLNKICPWDEGIWLDTRAPRKMNHYSSQTWLTQCLCLGVGRAVLHVVTRSWDSGAPLSPNSPPQPQTQQPAPAPHSQRAILRLQRDGPPGNLLSPNN